MAARVAGCGYERCPTMYTAVLVHKSEKHSFPVTNTHCCIYTFAALSVASVACALLSLHSVRCASLPYARSY